MTNHDDPLIRVNLQIDRALHRTFKIWCLENGHTVRSGLEMAIKSLIKTKIGGAAAMGFVESKSGVWVNPNAPDQDISGLFKPHDRVAFELPKPDTGPAPGPKAKSTAAPPATPPTPPAAATAEPPAAEPFVPDPFIPDPDDMSCDPSDPNDPRYIPGFEWDDDNDPECMRHDWMETARKRAERRAAEQAAAVGSEPSAFTPSLPADEIIGDDDDSPVDAKGWPKPEWQPKKVRAPADLAALMGEFEPRDRSAPSSPTAAPTVAPTHANGNGNGHALGPITAREYEVPAGWVDADGTTRAENLKRYGEDEDVEYWPPVKEAGLDTEAPIDLSAVGPVRRT